MPNVDKYIYTKEVLEEIYKLFPNAHCELIYHNVFELAVATILSAQTTDKSVNKVTPALFLKYPTKNIAISIITAINLCQINK